MAREQSVLTDLARLGFAELDPTVVLLAELDGLLAGIVSSRDFLPVFAHAADPDQALRGLAALVRQSPTETIALVTDVSALDRLVRVLGASRGLGEFLLRHPEELFVLALSFTRPPSPEFYRLDLADSVSAIVASDEEASWDALRVRYRRHVTQLAAWDLGQAHPLDALDSVAAALADLAAAALDAALMVARTTVRFPAAEVAATRLAIIGMGKAGARELNYVSDVDVIFVAGGSADLTDGRVVEIATRLAMATMRGIQDYSREPALWEVDANLRPEGKDGALVRTLDSHIA
ncbi:MAG: bifunctional glutamine-synthetase adenylyltransferase/deadenyltransferase, partial [Candidatus Saccharibacteria bacterium]|nr:bifunctional glutamine-synthetase adenylyltransferase/deadenyltransferase [Microbacteriaceae bacterium]